MEQQHVDTTIKGLMTEEKIDKCMDMLAATSILQQQAADIRATRINWQSYLTSGMIAQEDYNVIVQIDGYKDKDERERYFQSPENRFNAIKTFINLMGSIAKEQTLQYLLILVDDIIQEDSGRVEYFHEYSAKAKLSCWAPFLNFLNRGDGFIPNMASRILAKMACWSKVPLEREDLHYYLTWLKNQLLVQHEALANEMHAAVEPHNPEPTEHYKEISSSIDDQPVERTVTPYEIPRNEFIQSVARCLQMMLRVDQYRFAFVSVDGISTLLSVLTGRVNFQVQYQLIFCLWVLTFNPLLAEKMNKFNVIPLLADILSDSVKEKVTRIILAVFRNLIEKPEDPQVAKEHCIAMVQSKVLKQLSIFEQRRFDDEDVIDDIDFLSQRLQLSVQDLSSFDEYSTEVKSGRLEWSPVHKSAKFWRENAGRLNERNYELLRILIHLLEGSQDPLVLSVACFDIGEYVRHYARGKHVIEQLGGKQLVMQLLAHEDPNVRYEALLAVQKLMVHNWEYLGRQLEKETGGPQSATTLIARG
ncbi:V-type proton ATPase subunit H isoform X1 [Chrysoperla carnea]|uniref:V-type proton ATPase subunit H isoform X1 n=1 Tax=Chrysoperla carnea TaxID=189513 RepID=UPI001D068DD9|nr:V-type proton ATPase subunit H isoform X1 [Chrysoperla carnea]